MKTLAEYLAEYLDHEHESGDGTLFIDSYPDGSVNLDVGVLESVLKQGIDAYCSTENCEVLIQPNVDGDNLLDGEDNSISVTDAEGNKVYACEFCNHVKTDVKWREQTEQYECGECYAAWLSEEGG